MRKQVPSGTMQSTSQIRTGADEQHRGEMILRGIKLLNVAVNVMMFAACWVLFYQAGTRLNLSVLLIIGYLAINIWLGRIYNAFHVDSLRISEVLLSLSLASVICNVISFVAIVCVRWMWASPLPLLGLTAIQFAWNALWAYGANRFYFRHHKPRRAVFIYQDEEDLEKIQSIPNLKNKFIIEKRVKELSDIKTVLKEIEDYHVVFVAGIPATLRNGIAKYCVENDIEMYALPHVGDVLMAGAKHMQMYSVPLMQVMRARPIPEYLFVKRLLDILVSSIALILVSPIMLLTALAIKLQDGGPVIYHQTRLTKDRRPFEILKFRSMIVSAEGDGKARLASEHDDRITPVGRFIRAYRIDELPQLINILRGDMSIVGPRPERPEIAEQYEAEIPAFSLRLQVKAGLTGVAQVCGRYNSTPYDKLEMDLMYINDMSFLEDLRLMIATVKVLFQKESTEGIEARATTALKKRG